MIVIVVISKGRTNKKEGMIETTITREGNKEIMERPLLKIQRETIVPKDTRVEALKLKAGFMRSLIVSVKAAVAVSAQVHEVMEMQATSSTRLV